MPGVEPSHVEINDAGRGIRYGAFAFQRGDPNNTDRYSQRFSLNYVTGSHNFKTGVQLEQLVDNVYRFNNQNVEYRFANGVPNRITQYAGPTLRKDRAFDVGIYAQDQWTIDKLTLNLGVRFEKLWGYSPAQDAPGLPATPDSWKGALRTNEWLGERSFARVDDIPNWNDISPRVGLAYDVFGDGRTAIKYSLGRYVAKIGNEITQLNNPIVRSVESTNRSWNDANTDYTVDCDLGNFSANEECGAINNNNFGKNNPNAIAWDPAVLSGLRDSNWDMSAEVVQEIADGLSMTVGYSWNNAGYNSENGSKTRITHNRAVGAADFDEYCVTAPSNPKLPGGGGNQVCGLYDIKPTSVGQVDNIITQSSLFGDVLLRNQFFNVTFDGRLGNGIQIGGGVDTGTTGSDRCFVVDTPQELLYCKTQTPYGAQTQLKAYGSVPLPGDFLVGFAYQNLSGPGYGANLLYSSGQIEPSLGRPLSSGGYRSVPIVDPTLLYGDRISRLDLRMSKIVNYGRLRFQINFDAYNIANTSDVRSINSAYGSRWGYANSIIDARLLQLGGQIDF